MQQTSIFRFGRTLGLTMACAGVALFAIGCNAADAGSGNTVLANTYFGAGPEWTAQLNPDSSFMLIHFPVLGDLTADQLIDGTFATTSTGLIDLTVTASAGTGQPAEGAEAVALELPRSLLVVAPFGMVGAPIAMVPSGSCPSTLVAENMIKVKVSADWTAASSDASATFTFDPNSGVAAIPARYDLPSPTSAIPNGSVAMGAGSCESGLMTASLGAELFLTEAGGAVVHMQPSAAGTNEDEIYLALPQTAAPVTPATLAGGYTGLLFQADAAGPSTTAVQVTLSMSGAMVTGAATQVSTPSTASTLGAQLVITGSGAANGLVNGTIDSSSPNGGGIAQPLTCEMQPNADGTISGSLVVCAGTDQQDHFLSLLLVGQ